ncbi:TPM domain-containing protein [Niabella pedocola]|uniref:TPM domain-containing protein n=1 Tax=Niabella pedocola TaxID=1752077 RepID=A0ABS8PSK4_9BACT|nr:TPM domain-containing protein [Niabella pedocola]MCD2423784.1 TPM domain-containing protein [Niabella pedocola]
MTHLARSLSSLFFLLWLLICLPVTAQRKWTVKEVPDPKSTPSFNYVSNPDGILSSSTVAEINGHLKRLEDSTTDQVAVVVLQSIGKKVPRDFAMELLRYWGVGRKDKNNGVLMLLVMDQRRMEFEVGYGLEGKLTDLVSKQIQEDYMVPYAKQGNYDAAVLNGVQQVVQLLSGTVIAGAYGEAVPDAAIPLDVPAQAPSYGNTPGSGGIINLYQKHVGWGGFWVLLLYVIFFLAGLKTLFEKKDRGQFFDAARPWWFLLLRFLGCYVLLPVIIFGIAGVPVNIFTGVAFFYVFALVATSVTVFRLLAQLRRKEQQGAEDDMMYFYARQLDQRWKQSIANKVLPFPLLYYRERVGQYLTRLKEGMVISDTGSEMRLQEEKQDDNYLTDAQKMEEQLKSVDYDVWAENGGKAFKLHGVLLSSKYSHCPRCNTMAYYLESDRTIEAATYSSSGVGLKVYTCKFCHYQERKEYTIPRKSQSSSGSSGSSGSSSSSSSGSSWGGGSSGGGGAGSSW